MGLTRKTDLMQPGDEYLVKSGEFKGKRCTIIDPTVQGPESPFQRKIKVSVGGEEVYILPRMIDTGSQWQVPNPSAPVAPAHPVAPVASTPAPTFTSGALPEVVHLDDPMFDPYRPDPKIVDEYIGRTVGDANLQDTEFLLTFFRRRRNLMLVGDTQAGKTMLVQVLAVLAAREAGYDKPLPIFTLSGSSGVSDFDLFGQPTAYTGPDGVERLVWLSGLVDLAVRYGGILYLDEVNRMGDNVVSSLHPVCDHRRSFINRMKAVEQPLGGFMPEQVRGHDDLWIVGTINPGYKGAGAMQEAFINRFTWVEWGYDEQVESTLIPLNAVRMLGEALREARRNRMLNTPVGTAILAETCVNAKDFGASLALSMLRALFPPQEQGKFDAIVEDRSFEMLLADEVRDGGLAA